MIPLNYLLLLLLLIAVISGYSLLTGSALYENISTTPHSSAVLMNLVRGLKSGIFLGGMLATLVMLNRAIRLEKHRFLSLIFLFFIALPTFFFGYFGVRTMERAYVLGDTPEVIDVPVDTIANFRGGALLYRASEASQLKEVVVYHFANLRPNPLNEMERDYSLTPIEQIDAPTIAFAPEVSYNSFSGEIIINQRSPYTADGAALVIHREDVSNSRTALFGRSGVLTNIDGVIKQLFSVLDEYADELSFRYIALVVTLMLFIFSTTLFLRFTRWPLINFMLAVLANIGGLFLTSIPNSYVIQEIAANFLQPRAMGYIAPALLGFFALMFILSHSFLPSMQDWVQEMNE